MARQRDAEFFEEYDHFLEGDSEYFTSQEVAPPRVVVDGAVVAAVDVYGDATPPHVRGGRALKNRMVTREVENRLFVPECGATFSLVSDDEFLRRGKSSDPKLASNAFKSARKIGFIGSARSHKNYYHWLIESVPRTMRILSEFPDATALANAPHRKYQDDFLELDFISNRVETVERGVFLQKAFIPTVSTRFFPMEILGVDTLPADEVLSFPRMLGPRLEGRQRRLYISRGDVGTRSIEHEPELRIQLESRDFDCMELEGIPLLDQAEKFHNAEVIVAPHGAGLSNMIFRCDQPCKVVEIMPIKRWTKGEVNCFFNLSALCGFQHYLFDCAYQDPAAHPFQQPWKVDHSALLTFLDREVLSQSV